jgi:hypothetical protein
MEDLTLRLGNAECPDDSMLLSPENQNFRLKVNNFGSDSDFPQEEKEDSVPEIATTSGS